MKVALYFTKWFCLSIFFMPALISHANTHYLLCGADEDGCSKDSYEDCVCIPYNMRHATEPYCFDFDNFLCTPLSETPNCDLRLVFKNQASCLAVNFQSDSMSSCPLTTEAFCKMHNLAICDKDGKRASCHR